MPLKLSRDASLNVAILTKTQVPMSQNVPLAVPWSRILETPANIEKLRLLCHSPKELKSSGYIIEPLTSTQLSLKSRCEKCGGERLFDRSANPG